MSSPFPGMDPYLEGSQWTSIHAELSVEIARQLAPRLSSRYVARTNERFVLSMPDMEGGASISIAGVYPDAFVAETGVAAPNPETSSSGGLAVAPAPLHMATVMPERIRLLTVEIRETAHMKLVTAIEVLSPTNKRREGRREYLQKRRRILLSSAHLMEIDLLRSGKRVPMQKPLPPYPYFVLLSRVEKRPLSDVWPIALSQPLPTVAIPLLASDADVPLDLQQALTSVYDTFRYDLTIDYDHPPEVPLRSEEEDAWAQKQIQGWHVAQR